MKTGMRVLGWVVCVLLCVGLVAVAIVLLAVRAAPGEWSVPVGRFDASVPTLLRWGSHPLARPLLDGRTFATRQGRWQMHARGDGAIEARCAPCALQLAALGPAPLRVAAATLVGHTRGADRFDGTLRIAGSADEGDAGSVLTWRAQLRADGLQIAAELPATPLAQALRPFGAELPEAARATLGGTLALAFELRIDATGVQVARVVPRLADIMVDGLGTGRLADADLSARCRPQPTGGRIEGWLPHAVVAAEDARFFEHPGYEIDQWLAAFEHNTRSDALIGASTITMQLGKIVYTGDERSATRKLREWLYAVEMERTLGKGRILQLYLAVVPWGDGVCGAEAAARHHLGKTTAQLRPREAAFLASLLVNPDAQVRRWAADDGAARERAAAVLRGMRRLPRERREAELAALAHWQPPVGRALLARQP